VRSGGLLTVLLVLALMLPAGCVRQRHSRPAPAPGQAGMPTPAGPPVQEATRLLTARGAALVRKDRAAFLAVVDARRATYRRQQERMFASLQEVPLDSFEHRITAWDPLVDELRRRYQPDPIFVADLQIRYRLRGQALPTVGTSAFTFVRTASGWRIGGENEAPFADRPSYQLWDDGKLRSLASSRTLVVFRPGAEALATRVLRSADKAYSRVDRVWGSTWDHHAVFIIPSGPQQTAKLLDGWDMKGIPAAGPNPPDAKTPRDNVLYLNAQVLKPYSEFTLDYTFAHEMTHIATRTVHKVPFMMVEGFAEYVASHDLGYSFREQYPTLAAKGRSFDGKLVTYDVVVADNDLSLSYDRASSFCSWVAQTFGEAKLVALYHSFAGADWPSEDSKVEQEVLDKRFRKVLGASFNTVQRRWAGYIRAHI
jgi:hypothetical protein